MEKLLFRVRAGVEGGHKIVPAEELDSSQPHPSL